MTRMTMRRGAAPPRSLEEGNHVYQRRLVAALVAETNLEAAVDTCLSHGWDGVLGVLLARRDGGAKMPAGKPR